MNEIDAELGELSVDLFALGVACLIMALLAVAAARGLIRSSPVPHLVTPRRGGGPGWGLQGLLRRLCAMPAMFVVLFAIGWFVLATPALTMEVGPRQHETVERAVDGSALLLPCMAFGAVVVCAPRFHRRSIRLFAAVGGVLIAALLVRYPGLRPALDIMPVWSGYREPLAESVAWAVELALLPMGDTLPEQVLAGLVLVLLPAALVAVQAVRSLLRWF